MPSYQQITVMGHLGSDPKLHEFDDGGKLCNLSVATSEQWTDKNGEKKENTEWHRVVLYSRLAEVAAQYLAKGSLVLIVGKLRTRQWDDDSGVKRYVTEIIGREMKMIGSGKAAGDKAAKAEKQQPQDFDDDIPF